MRKKKKQKKRLAPIVLILLPILAVLFATFAIVSGVRSFVTTSDYFKVRDFKVEGLKDSTMIIRMRSEVLGENIFLLDTKKLSKTIKRKFPDLDRVTVTRVLPSRVVLKATQRLPVALLARDTFYLLDADGIALSKVPAAGLMDLPVIIGVEHKIKRVKVGQRYRGDALEKALALAKALRQERGDFLRNLPSGQGYVIKKIDVTRPGALSFWLGERIQVKVGDKNIKKKVTMLSSIFKSTGHDIEKVRYIDLRPKEPVVAMK